MPAPSSPSSPRSMFASLRASLRSLRGASPRSEDAGSAPQEPTPRQRILDSGLFDAAFYGAEHPEVVGDFLDHYLAHDRLPGHDPLPLFDTEYYLTSNPDVAASDIPPLVHFIVFGDREGRNPHPLFNAAYYLTTHAKLLPEEPRPLAHYLDYGARHALGTHPLFDPKYYVSQLEDVEPSAALIHSITESSGRTTRPHPLFDPVFYLESQPDVAASGLHPFIHYIRYGAREGRDPHPLFKVRYYLAQLGSETIPTEKVLLHYQEQWQTGSFEPHPLFDTAFYLAQRAGGLPLQHNPLIDYLEYGAAAGLSPHPLFDVAYYSLQTQEAIGPALIHYIRRGAEARLRPHPLFDPLFYLSQLSESDQEAVSDCLEHYLARSSSTALKPHPLFDAAYYLEQCPREQPTLTHALIDYVVRAPKDRDPHPLFHSRYYLEQIGPPAPRQSPLEHYLSTGAGQGISPHPLFDSDWYSAICGLGPGTNPLLHYATNRSSTCEPNPLFDSSWYLQQAPDAGRQAAPLEHYFRHGLARGLPPHPCFDSHYYLACNPDVALSKEHPILHFLSQGLIQGRDPHPLVNVSFFVQQSGQPLSTARKLLHGLLTGPIEFPFHPYIDHEYLAARLRIPPAEMSLKELISSLDAHTAPCEALSGLVPWLDDWRDSLATVASEPYFWRQPLPRQEHCTMRQLWVNVADALGWTELPTARPTLFLLPSTATWDDDALLRTVRDLLVLAQNTATIPCFLLEREGAPSDNLVTEGPVFLVGPLRKLSGDLGQPENLANIFTAPEPAAVVAAGAEFQEWVRLFLVRGIPVTWLLEPQTPLPPGFDLPHHLLDVRWAS